MTLNTKMERKPVTMRDVARAANVSQSTVSRILGPTSSTSKGRPISAVGNHIQLPEIYVAFDDDTKASYEAVQWLVEQRIHTTPSGGRYIPDEAALLRDPARSRRCSTRGRCESLPHLLANLPATSTWGDGGAGHLHIPGHVERPIQAADCAQRTRSIDPPSGFGYHSAGKLHSTRSRLCRCIYCLGTHPHYLCHISATTTGMAGQ